MACVPELAGSEPYSLLHSHGEMRMRGVEKHSKVGNSVVYL